MDGVLLIVDVVRIVFRVHVSIQSPYMESGETGRQDDPLGSGSRFHETDKLRVLFVEE